MTTYTLTPKQNLDVAGAQQLESELDSTSASDGDEVVLDLSGVAFVASSGLRVMLKYAQALDTDGAELIVRGSNDTVRDVLKMSGFDTIIKVE